MSQSKQAWLIRYHYDPLDQITSHTLSSTPTRHRFYCKKRLTTEIQGAIGYCIVQHDDLLLAQQQHLQDVHDTTLLATDLQRSALHTLKKNTQTQPIAYSPYGYRSVVNGLLSLLGFNGERPDPVTGHYLLGNYRAFNPVLMRFNSPDSLSPFGKGGLNAYAYCTGDPINYTDPTGQFTFGRLAKHLGLKSTTYNNTHTSKWGVSKNKSDKVFEKIQSLENKIKETVAKAQFETFKQDRTHILSAGAPAKDMRTNLQQIAYNKLFPGSKNIQSNSDIERAHQKPYAAVIKKSAKIELSEYHSTFEKLGNFPEHSRTFGNTLKWLEFNSSKRFPDDIQLQNYIQRINSIIPEKAVQIRSEINRLSSKYFKHQ